MSKKQWKSLGIQPAPPLRLPLNAGGVGTKGRPIQLTVNHFKVNIKNPNLTLWHYNVVIYDFKGEVKLPKKKQMKIFESMKQDNPVPFASHSLAYDSEKNAYSVGIIPMIEKYGSSKKYGAKLVEDGEKPQKYEVTLDAVNSGQLIELINALKSTAPQQRIELPTTLFQMLEVMFRHHRALKYEQIGRRFFFSQEGEFGEPYSISGAKEGVVGFFGSLRPASWKNGSVLLNIDIAHTAFYKPDTVMNFMKEACNYRGNFSTLLENSMRLRLRKELKNVKIQVNHTMNKRTYKVIDILYEGSDTLTFPLQSPDGSTRNCTVQEYFFKEYKKRLQYPRLNCLHVGNPKKNIYIPIECAEIAKRQKVQKKLSDRETAQFIRTTAEPPAVRLNRIKRIVKGSNFNSDPMLKALNFNIEDMPLRIDGRVLPAPQLTMKNDFFPVQGVWDIRNKVFQEGASLKKWVVMNYDPYKTGRSKVQNFLDSLRRMGKERGMSVDPPVHLQEIPRFTPEKVTEDFQKLKRSYPDLQLIVCVLSKDVGLYAQIKKAGDRDIETITQCIQGMNVESCKPATVSNLLLKINAKLGGVNNIIGAQSLSPVFGTPVTLMGADVNHPPANDSETPSLAAVVASYDRNATKYAVEVRHQRHRTEMIQDLTEITKNLLINFFKKTKRKPSRIVMYRDGVSESQFLEVLSFELKKMRDACTALEKGYEPGITFICVQKRHHTRLFCDERDGVGRSKNIPPGTIVDTSITHPFERDFYLCSHQGIQGTSRPTHYHVLWDDNDMTMDHLQALTYSMCHVYSRCTRAVSIPTPAYYAHLAAFRAKVHLSDLVSSDSGSMRSGAADHAGPSDAEYAHRIRVSKDKEIGGRLYYL